MFIPIRTDYRMSRTPLVNYALIAINVVVYMMGYNGSGENILRIYDWMLHSDSPQLVQFFTSVFLHGSFLHLAGNMLFLWVFGNAVNDRFGHVGYLAFYLAGGVLAGIGYVLLSGTAPVLGASGAIAAVTGVYLVLLPRTRVTMLVWFYIITTFEVSSLYFLAFQFVMNLVMSFSTSVGIGGGGVAYIAHSSGYVFGIVVAAGLLALRVLPRDTYDLLNLIRAGHRRQSFRRMVRGGYDPFNRVAAKTRPTSGRWVKTRTVDQVTPDTPAARELQLRRQISESIGNGDLATAAGLYLDLVQVADDPVLSRQQQLDIANHLMAGEQHAAAADAYERFLRHYGEYEYKGDIYLMLGLLYGRYLHQYDRAERCLRDAQEALQDPNKLSLARSDLEMVLQKRGK